MPSRYLGKIQTVKFGLGGYDDCMIGLTIDFRFNGCHGVADFKGTWCPGVVDAGKYSGWSEEDRSRSFDELMRFIAKLLLDTKRKDISELSGAPVEIEIEGNVLQSWRILTEVL